MKEQKINQEEGNRKEISMGMVHGLWHVKPSVFPKGEARALLGAMSAPLPDLSLLIDCPWNGKNKLSTTKCHCLAIIMLGYLNAFKRNVSKKKGGWWHTPLTPAFEVEASGSL